MLVSIYYLLITIAEHNAEFNDQTGTIKPSDATLEDRVTGFIYLYISSNIEGEDTLALETGTTGYQNAICYRTNTRSTIHVAHLMNILLDVLMLKNYQTLGQDNVYIYNYHKTFCKKTQGKFG